MGEQGSDLGRGSTSAKAPREDLPATVRNNKASGPGGPTHVGAMISAVFAPGYRGRVSSSARVGH